MAECRRRVRVRGREGEEVEWSRKAARRAGRLNDWLDDLDPSEDTVFPINETAITVLRTLGAMCDDDNWSASCLDECSLTILAVLIEGASNLIAEQALEYAQTAFARRLDGKRVNELRELLGAVDDFEGDEERVQALAEPAFTPDSPMPQSTTAGPPALPVNDDAAEAALAKVDVITLIELKGVNRAWRARTPSALLAAVQAQRSRRPSAAGRDHGAQLAANHRSRPAVGGGVGRAAATPPGAAHWVWLCGRRDRGPKGRFGR